MVGAHNRATVIGLQYAEATGAHCVTTSILLLEMLISDIMNLCPYEMPGQEPLHAKSCKMMHFAFAAPQRNKTPNLGA